MDVDNSQMEIADFIPSWIDGEFPNDDEYISVKDIIKFYLINCPCEKVSSRGFDISLWGKPNVVLWEKVKNKIGLRNGENFEYGNSKNKMKQLYKKYEMHKEFFNIVDNTDVFLNTGNVFESLFKHIRNAIAHSRWQVVDDILYFEDGNYYNEMGRMSFYVTARIVLKKETMLQVRDVIMAGPSEEEKNKINISKRLDYYIKKLKEKFGTEGFVRKEASAALGIDNEMWKKVYSHGKKENEMIFEKRRWRMKNGYKCK